MTAKIGRAAVAALFALVAPAMAQPGGPQQRTGHDMPGMDMPTMMGQCAQMRQQMKPGARMSPDMQATMRQCDGMDRQMGSGSATPDAPRTHTRTR